LLGFTARWSQLALKTSVLALSLVAKKAAFDFMTYTTFRSKSSVADG